MTVVEQTAAARLGALEAEQGARLHGLATRILGDHAAAEDVCQEAFAKLAASPLLERPDAEAVAWLRRVVLNGSFNALRSRRRATARDLRAAALHTVPAEDVAEDVVRRDEIARVRTVLSRLPERQQAVLMLRHSGHRYAEIAATLEVAPASVGTLLARAERAFRALFDKEESR